MSHVNGRQPSHPLFAMKAPCGNCPFLKVGAIPLRPGRVAGIIASLMQNDREIFHCHKTVHHHTKGGQWTFGEDGKREYVPSGKESACAGALIYSLKAGNPPVALRFALSIGLASYDDLMGLQAFVLDPPNYRTPT
jgi:hypothetical protein